MKKFLIISMIFLLLSVALCTAEDVSSSGSVVKLSFRVNDEMRTAALYVPPGYETSRDWPLVVYLHGGGGRGTNSGKPARTRLRKGPIMGAVRQNNERFKALVLMPQCPEGKIWAPVPPDPIQSAWRLRRHGREPVPDAEAHVTEAIDATVKQYPVDEDRITLTGHSMGGEGTMRYAALHPNRFAAIAPSAGAAVIVPEDAPKLAGMGVWIFQGENDGVSSAALARRMVDAIRTAGGEVRYTEFKDANHGIAKRVYRDTELIDWLLKQKRQDVAGMGDQFCGVESAEEVLVDWETKKAKVNKLGAETSRDEGLTVAFPEAGTGVMLTAPDGKWDLSDYVVVAIDIQNPGGKPVTLIGRLNGHPWADSFLHVPAGSKDTMIIHMMRKTLDDRRKEQFVDMKGIPGGHLWHWDAFHPGKVKSVMLRDLGGTSAGRRVRITAVRAIGAYSPLSAQKEKTFFPFVDKFGQFKHRGWPGKVKSAEGLKKSAAKELQDIKKNPPPSNRDKYGGWKNGPKIKATGHFRTAKHRDKWWLVDPKGYLFWSHGINGVRFRSPTKVAGRKNYFEDVPQGSRGKRRIDFAEANLAAKYGPDWKAEAADMAHRRLESWGMNTVANWSSPQVYELDRTPYVVPIHYAGWGNDGLADLLQNPKEFREALRKRLMQEKGKTSDDPWCIGYFVDNEIKWRRGMDAEFYYKTVREEVKRVAPNKLYLGSRLHGHAQPHGSKPHLIAAAAKYCDVVSINRYRFSPSDVRMLDGVDVPLIIGEFHFGALDRGMLHTGLRGVSNQQQRAYAYEHYVKQALKHPHIVGTHWFTYRDQPITGRGDGENYQIGFVDICDTPYRETLEASRRIGKEMYEIRSGGK